MEGAGFTWRLENCEKSIEEHGRRTDRRFDEFGRRIDVLTEENRKIEVLEERDRNRTKEVQSLHEEIRGLKRALWAFVFSILTGALIFLLTQVGTQVGG